MEFLEIEKEIREGKNLDVHIKSENKFVRKLVAEKGYKLEELINDPSDTVRAAVARQGYGWDQLRNDVSDWVKFAVLETQEAHRKRNAGYDICHRIEVGGNHFVVGHNPKAPAQYVTWEYVADRDYYYNGHYFTDQNDAIVDMFKRAGESLQMEGRSLGLSLLNDDDRMMLREESEREAVCYALSELLSGTDPEYDYEALINNPNFMERAIRAFNNIDHSYENEAFSEQLESIMEDFPDYKTAGNTMPAYDEAKIKISPEEADLLNDLLKQSAAEAFRTYGPLGDNFTLNFLSDSGHYSGNLELCPSSDPLDSNKLSETEPHHAVVRVWNCKTGDLLYKQTYTAKQLNQSLTGDYGFAIKEGAFLKLNVEPDESLRRLNNAFIFRTDAEDQHYAKHNGELCTVKRGLTPKECDMLITGLMWEVEFSDGDRLHVFNYELELPAIGEKKPSLTEQIRGADARQGTGKLPGDLPDISR